MKQDVYLWKFETQDIVYSELFPITFVGSPPLQLKIINVKQMYSVRYYSLLNGVFMEEKLVYKEIESERYEGQP